MSGNSILLDSNIVLYLLGGDKTLVPLLQDRRLYVSFITQLEVLSYRNFSETELSKTKEFVNACTVIDITADIKETTVALRRKYELKLPDCIIIATARYLGIPLITADKDFTKVRELDLILYER
ncbi:MAG: type II toxin-antitoxin system VapC family toxin [Bacteroidota bacterium]